MRQRRFMFLASYNDVYPLKFDAFTSILNSSFSSLSLCVSLCVAHQTPEPDFLCHGSQSLEEERIQCNVPVLESSEGMDDSGEVDGHRTEKKGDGGGHRKKKSGPGRGQVLTASVSLSVGGRTAVWEDGVSYELRRCSVAWDCNDGDACTVDTCVMVRARYDNGAFIGYCLLLLACSLV